MIKWKKQKGIQSLNQTERTTFIYDTMRQGIDGIDDIFATILFILIAIQSLGLSSEYKALLIASKFIGYTLPLFSLPFCQRLPIRRSTLAGICNVASGVTLILAGVIQSNFYYTFFASLHLVFFNFKIPLFAQLYRENYNAKHRGRLFGYSLGIRRLTTALFSLFIALVLQSKMTYYPLVFTVYGILLIWSGWLSAKIPSSKMNNTDDLGGEQTGSLRQSFVGQIAPALKDKLFLYVCLAWFFIGLGNLALVPIRVEYLNDRTIPLSQFEILLILQIIPGIVTIFSTFFWGRVFDKIPMLLFRIFINLLFAISIFFYFRAEGLLSLIIFSSLLAASQSGADFIWNLWVIHLAPQKNLVQGYMNLHLFLTGTRGILGPFLSYWLLIQGNWSYSQISSLASGMILFSSLLFLSMSRSQRISLKA